MRGAPALTIPTVRGMNLIPASRRRAILPFILPPLAKAQTRAWVCVPMGAGRQRYRRAWGFLPAAVGPLRRRRGSTPAPTRDAREDGGFDGSKSGSLFSGCERPRYRFGRCGERGQDLALHGAAMAASEIRRDMRARPRRPGPCLFAIGDSASRSRPPRLLLCYRSRRRQPFPSARIYKAPSVSRS